MKLIRISTFLFVLAALNACGSKEKSGEADSQEQPSVTVDNNDTLECPYDFIRIKGTDVTLYKGPSESAPYLMSFGNNEIGDIYSTYWVDEAESYYADFNPGKYSLVEGVAYQQQDLNDGWSFIKAYGMGSNHDGWVNSNSVENVEPVSPSLDELLSSTLQCQYNGQICHESVLKKITVGKYAGSYALEWDVADMSGFVKYYICTYDNGHLYVEGQCMDEDQAPDFVDNIKKLDESDVLSIYFVANGSNLQAVPIYR